MLFLNANDIRPIRSKSLEFASPTAINRRKNNIIVALKVIRIKRRTLHIKLQAAIPALKPGLRLKRLRASQPLGQVMIYPGFGGDPFRNGERNLHFLHVNREKGRSCRACHDEHASNQPKHIRESVPFGRWTMHTQYTKTETGGGCTTGCHRPYSYDRDNPKTNKTPESRKTEKP